LVYHYVNFAQIPAQWNVADAISTGWFTFREEHAFGPNCVITALERAFGSQKLFNRLHINLWRARSRLFVPADGLRTSNPSGTRLAPRSVTD